MNSKNNNSFGRIIINIPLEELLLYNFLLLLFLWKNYYSIKNNNSFGFGRRPGDPYT